MLANPKAPFLASGAERKVFPLLGPLAIRLFGWPLGLHARLVARIISQLLRGYNGKLLDVGGSYGPHAFELARRGWDVTVIDIDQDNLELGERIDKVLGASNVSFRYGDILNADLPDGEFDAVLGVEVIEHIKDDRRAIKEMGRVLKSGGLLVLATPYSAAAEEYATPTLALSRQRDDIPNDVFVGGGHWRSGYNEQTMTSLLEGNGFLIEGIAYVRYPRVLPQSAVLFPVTYPLALLTSRFSRNRVGLVVKARKR